MNRKTKKRLQERINFKIILICVFLLGILFLYLGFVGAQSDAQSTVYYCAERTKSGAWCQNVPLEEIDTNYTSIPTSCEVTDYCKLGVCVNAMEGSCRPNVPKRVCEADGGIWDQRPRDDIPRCQLGCCYVGGSAAFVTQTKCTSLSALYGVEIENFNSNIRDPIQCIASAFPEEKGACVSDDGFLRNCKILTSSECQTVSANSPENTNVEFYKGTLCTAAHLETICGPTEKTKIVEGRDEVFFIDSCGNIANIYDATKINPVVYEYWDYMIGRADSCVLEPDLSNANVCGSCDFFEGSIGKKYERNNPQMFPNPPEYGEYMCADLSCKSGKFAEEFKISFGRWAEQGERWCSNTATSSEYENNPGSEYFRLACIYGEVLSEPGDPFRQTICLESEIEIEGQDEGFKTAEFRANQWQDCVLQDNKEDCENTQKRDCGWVVGQTLGLLHYDEDENPLVVNEEGELVPRENEDDERKGAVCVPKYPIGLWFWDTNKTQQHQEQKGAGDICMVASEVCRVKVEKALLGSAKCIENCHCLGLEAGDVIEESTLNNEWVSTRNQLCVSIGDCGASENYIGKQGYWEEKDLVELIEGKWGE